LKETFKKLYNFAKEKNDLLKFDKNNICLNIKGKHVEGVVNIVKKIYPNDELLELCAYLHDVGRGLQFEKINSFNDKIITHNVLGVSVFDEFIKENNIETTKEIDIIRNVILYHGRMDFEDIKLDIKTSKIVHIVTVCDDIQNGCIDAISYLEMEYNNDLKDYIKNNTLIDQKKVSKEVMCFFENGINFDKIKLCNTYADYFIFACSRATNACRSEFGELAKSAMKLENCGYKNTISAYEDIFKKYIEEKYIDKCIKTLYKFCT
jgi:hypothetical protein